MLKKFLITVFEDTGKRRFWAIHSFLGAVIIASLFSVFFESDPSIFARYGDVLVALEYAFAAIFALEYLIYIYLSKRRLSYIFSFYGIVDLLSP